MRNGSGAPWGLRAIIVFYVVGVCATAIALFTNRVATGEQLALVHGLPASTGAPAILLTMAAGALVVVGLNSMRPWGYWFTVSYMGFLLLVPPLALGGDRVSLFANVAWPIFVIAYLSTKRRLFGLGATAERLANTSS